MSGQILVNYADNPEGFRKYLKTLPPEQVNLVIDGYLLACSHMKEVFSEGNTELLTAKLKLKQNTEKRRFVDGCIDLLDTLEDIIDTRAKSLEKLHQSNDTKAKP